MLSLAITPTGNRNHWLVLCLLGGFGSPSQNGRSLLGIYSVLRKESVQEARKEADKKQRITANHDGIHLQTYRAISEE